MTDTRSRVPSGAQDSANSTQPTSAPAGSAPAKSTSLETSKWSLDLYVSPDLSFNHIQSADPSLLQFERNVQHPEPSYSFGLRVSKTFGEHFSAKLGLQFSRINISLNGDSIGIGLRIKMNGLDIPILVGYQTSGNDRFTTAVNAGIIYNVYSWYDYSRPSFVDSQYRSHTGISLYLGFNFIKGRRIQ